LRGCLLFRVSLFGVVLFFPPLPPLDFAAALAALPLALPLDFAESSKSNKSTVALALGLALDVRLTRRNAQEREIDETVIELGSTYLILLVRLNMALILLGRRLAESIASNLVSGLYDLTIPFFVLVPLIFRGAVLLSVSRYSLNETVHFSLFNKSEI
jgi:hypothetical protein